MSHPPRPIYKLVTRLLQACVVCQCLGNAVWFGYVGETPLFSLLWGDPGVGGWGFEEPTVRGVHVTLGAFWLAAAAVTAVKPVRIVLAVLTALQLMIAVAMAWTGDGFQLAMVPLPGFDSPVLRLFPLFSQSARMAAPLGLLLMLGNSADGQISRRAIAVLRWAAVATFAAHGVEAMAHYPVFVDMNINAARRVFGVTLSQLASQRLLTAIGAIDILVAVWLAARQSPLAAGYMTLWGAITATGRVVAFAWSIYGISVFTAFATRVPHAIVPLVLVLCWRNGPDSLAREQPNGQD